MEFLHSIFFALHMLGLAAVIGSFFVQLRRKTDFVLWPTLIGAITQVVSGLALVGLASADEPNDYTKIAVKAVIAGLVLTAAIFAVVMKKKGGKVQPWFHTAGGLAIVNVFVAVFWG